MRARIASLVIALALPAQVFADCKSERDLVFRVFEQGGSGVLEPGRLFDGATTCKLDGAVLSNGAVLNVELGTITWQLNGFDGELDDRVALDLTVKGARMVPQSGDRWIDYMLDVQNRRSTMDAHISGQLDFGTGRLEVSDLSLDLRGNNRFRASYAVDGMSRPLFQGDPAALTTLSLSELDLTIENEGYADGLILGLIVGAFSDVPGSPETVIEATKSEIKAVIGSLPDSLIDGSSRDALNLLVSEGPVPWGQLSVTLKTEAGLGADRVFLLGTSADPLSRDTLEAVFEGAEIDITYSPPDAAE